MQVEKLTSLMLVGWVREYETRDDEFSLREHRRLFDTHEGKKFEYRSNEEVSRRVSAGATPRAKF